MLWCHQPHTHLLQLRYGWSRGRGLLGKGDLCWGWRTVGHVQRLNVAVDACVAYNFVLWCKPLMCQLVF